MFGQSKPRGSGTPLPPSESQRFLAAQGVDRTLPQRLLRRTDGRLHEPIQLAQPQRGAAPSPSLAQEMTLLLLRQPAGGWESLVEANRQTTEQAALTALELRLSESTTPMRRFLDELGPLVEQERQVVQARLTEIEGRAQEVEGRLAQWQQEQGQGRGLVEAVGSLLQTLVRGHLSQSEAVACWNEREGLALARESHRAALAVLVAFGEAVGRIARALEQVLDEAASAQRQAIEAGRRLSLEAAQPWDYQVSAARIGQALSGGIEAHHLTAMLAALREGGSEALLAQVQRIAQAEAVRRLAEADIAALIEWEGQHAATEAEGEEPDVVVLVGHLLLERLQRHPMWYLVPGARRRVEWLQIVPQGSAIFDHPSLKSAAYGTRRDRLAFLRVELEVALDEVRGIAEGEASFRAAHARREYFILEEVAQAWQPPAAPHETATPDTPPATPSPVNGQLPASASEQALW